VENVSQPAVAVERAARHWAPVVVSLALLNAVAVRLVVRLAVAVHHDCAVVSDVGGDTQTTTASQSTHNTAVDGDAEPTAGVVLAVEPVVAVVVLSSEL